VKIEEAIKQTRPFESEHQKAGVNLMYTHGWYASQLRAFFKKFGLTAKQYNILRILKGAGQPVSTSFVRERLLDKMSDVSRIVDRMHDKGLLSKSVCSNDKRLVDLSLTDEAHALMGEVRRRTEIMEQIMSNLDEDELRTLNDLLDKMRGK